MNRDLDRDDEVGLLDLLILIAENLRLLVVGSVCVGLIAVGLTYTIPKQYVSQAILALPSQTPGLSPVYDLIKGPTLQQATKLITSPRVLDPVIASLKLDEGTSAELAREELMQQVKVTASPDELLLLEVSSSTPEKAQNLANAIIDSWRHSSALSEEKRSALQELLSQAESSLAVSGRLIDRFTAEAGNSREKNAAKDDSGLALIAAAVLQARSQSEVAKINDLLQGSSIAVVKQPPTLPTSPESVSKVLIGLLSALATLLALLLWIFIAEAWRGAAQNGALAPKLLRLRSALGLK